MASAHNIGAALRDGSLLAHRYDEVSDSFLMRPVTRDAHDAATFITDEYLGAQDALIAIGRAQAIDAVPRDNSLHFIFHSAFCASTMLARGFNLPGLSMGLKEPVLLNDIVGYRRRGAPPAAVAERTDHALHMLARPFGSDRSVIAKPSNVFNSLAPLALTLRPQAKAILLYAPLKVFLISVARKGLWCRLWCRELLEGLITDGIVDLGFEPRDYFLQSDLQVAAVGWLAQQRLFQNIARQFGPERIATLDSEQLTADPPAALAAALKHFGLAATDMALHSHSAFSTHSKFGGDFNSDDRKAEHQAAAAAHADEIEKIVSWTQHIADSAGIDFRLPHLLLPA